MFTKVWNVQVTKLKSMDFSKQALSVVVRWENFALLTLSTLLQVTILAVLLMTVDRVTIAVHLLQAQAIILQALATRGQAIILQVLKHVDHVTAQVVNLGVGDAAL